MNEHIHIRPREDGDFNFILNSWMKSYKKYSGVRPDVYFVEHHKLVHHILSRADVLIASSRDNHEQIYGYLIYEPDVFTIIHFAFVKQTFRHLNVMKELLDSINLTDPVIVTHDNRHDLKHIQKRLKIFNPYKAFGDLHEIKKTGFRPPGYIQSENADLRGFHSSQSEY